MALTSPIVVVDDGQDRLGSLADLRPVFCVRTGALSLVERVEMVFGAERIAAWWVPEGKRGLSADLTRGPVNDGSVIPGEVVVLNGRCVGVPGWLERLAVGDVVHDPTSGHVVAARMEGGAARMFLETGILPEGMRQVRDPDVIGGTATSATRTLIEPWDVIRHRDAALEWDLRHLIERTGWTPPGGVARIGAHAVAAAPSVKTFPGVVLDASAGPIVVDEDATLRPNCVVCGPAYIGKGSTVLDGAVIRPNCAIGPVCKVNGEVSGTIFQGHANKAHDGFVGDSWVGEWANLGANTITSNLLNTYSEIVSQSGPDARRVRTGLTFFGSIIGDHVKTAIGTRLMTGSVIGTGAMVALSSHAPTAIRRFAWMTDEGTRSYRLDKFIEVMHAVMHRRGVRASQGYTNRVRDLILSSETAGSPA